MLNGRDQWYNEGQPVMRHLRKFEIENDNKDCYCIFIAPRMHTDTLNTFLIANKYGYEGKKQRIIPISIRQISIILLKLKDYLENGISFNHSDFKMLLDKCSNLENISETEEWMTEVENQISRI